MRSQRQPGVLKCCFFFLLASWAAVSCHAQNDTDDKQTPLLEYQYAPGNLNVFDLDMWLSQGLTARVLATKGEAVLLGNGNTTSQALFHEAPDGAAVFDDINPNNTGGYIYVSNSEVDNGGGGVGALYFDKDGTVLDYKMLLEGTNRNCNGGKTAWHTWVSCEEVEGGQCWQVDPYGTRPSEPIAHGSQGGLWEAFAHDLRNPLEWHFFLTEDVADGALQRMTISNPADYQNNTWNVLNQPGPVDYLYLTANRNWLGVDLDTGTFEWTKNEAMGRLNAAWFFPNAEGLEMVGNELLVVSKTEKGFLRLNLDTQTYTYESTGFHGQPDQLTTVVQADGSMLTYFTEEAAPIQGFLGEQVGIHTLSQKTGKWTNIMEASDHSSEITGIAFSPDAKRMLFAFQEDGILMELQRTDGLAFHDQKARETVNTGNDDDDDCFWIFCGFEIYRSEAP